MTGLIYMDQGEYKFKKYILLRTFAFVGWYLDVLFAIILWELGLKFAFCLWVAFVVVYTVLTMILVYFESSYLEGYFSV